jgi:hypothetical protein
MKRLLLPALAVTFAACSPDIPTGANQSNNFVVAEFDPANNVIPLPNDLVAIDPATGRPDLDPTGRIARLHAPETGGTDAQNEFNRDYLNHLDGFPLETAGSVLFDKPIDVTTVVPFNGTNASTATLAVFDVKNVLPVSNLTITVSDAPDGGQTLNFIPPGGTWPRDGRYAVLLLGGANGVKGKVSGQTVTASPTFSFVLSSTPLITCDASGNNCIPATLAIPTTAKDPGAQHDQRVALAKELEQLRLSYKPIIDGALQQIPTLKRTDIALVWTFTITSQAEVTFDPASLIIPFPNDILNPTGSQVAIPPGSGLPPALVAGLNTLDGFSNTAPIVSENGPDTGPLVGRDSAGTPARVDSASVKFGSTGTVNLVAAGPGGGALPTTLDGGIQAHACLNCPGIVVTEPDGGPVLLPDGGVKPDTLAIVPDIPLTERTLHAAYITTDLKDTSQKNVIASPAFALVRSSTPLYAGGHTTVSLLNDAQAQLLEPLRSALNPLFNNLNSAGLPRTKVALAWAFTTQSTVSALSKLHAAPALAPGLPATPLWIADVTAEVTAQLDGLGIPHTAISAFWAGEILDLWALNSTHFMPGLTDAVPKKMPFVMAVPAGSAPGTGWPVTIFGHGLTGNKTNMYAIANTLASVGNVSIAIDEPWHGDRATCTGFGNYVNQATSQTIFTDADACSNPATQTCNAAGRCQLTNRTTQACTFADPTSDLVCLGAGQGACAPDNHCEGAGAGFATSLTVAPGVSFPISGWNIFNLQDFFATRDNFRQQTISLAQLARVMATSGPGGLNTTPPSTAVKLDPTKMSYVSQSLGSFLGSLYTAVAPEIGNTALNVAGSDWLLNLLTSPAFTPYKNGLIAGLAAQGIEQNSPEYDQFLTIAKWIIDPADPVNAAYYVTHSANLPAPLPPNITPQTRRTLIQWILDDQVVVNPSTVELVNAAMGSVVADPKRISASPFWSYQYNDATNLGPGNALSNVPTSARHPFLLQPFPNASGAALTGSGQQQVGTFIAGAPPPFP